MKTDRAIRQGKKNLFRFFLLLHLFFSTCVLKANPVNEGSFIQQEDSLLAILSQTNISSRKIPILRELTLLNKHTPKEVVYAEQVFELANQLDSMHYGYEAIYFISRYYCNAYKLDSLRYWVNRLDSIATARDEVPQELFSVHNALCRLYVMRGEYGVAMNEAVKQQILAEKSENPFGLVSCYENWGLLYIVTNRYGEAIQSLESCISILKTIEDQYILLLQVNENLIRSYLYQREFEKAEQALNYHEQVLTKVEASNETKYTQFPSDEIHAIIETYRVKLYAEMDRPDKVAEVIKRLEPYSEHLTKNYILTIYNYAMAKYSYLLKNYTKALHYINQPEIDLDDLYFKLKVNIYLALGNKQEALNIYKQCLKQDMAERDFAYTRQIDQLRTIQLLNEKEKSAQNLALQQKELENQHTQFAVLNGLSFVLLIFIAFWIWYLIHTKRLRNELLNEQVALKKTNVNLTREKEKAEKADKLKSNFIANISHEIRTPLNAIVGFASLLKDSEGEERAEYIQVINNNSDLLLNLVSEVLDLSHLSDHDFNLNLQTANLEECCRNALSTVGHNLSPKTKIVFTHPESPYVMLTDSLRLQQLLVNLLGNSAKFTNEGEIILDYTVDEERSVIVFSVTDTGCGIPLEKQHLIFNRFEKVDHFKQGTGLGLSICITIAQRFGGKLFVDPAYTSGARFVFELPMV